MARSTPALAIILAIAAMAAAQEEVMSLYQPRDPCPQVEKIVKDIVDREFRSNNQITAGLLRVFFHDCFTGGCDASILLDGEWDAGVNAGSVQPRVRELVNEIRAEVNRQCGDRAVSCADILALATRDSVAAAGGPRTSIFRGRFDSDGPRSTSKLPSPFDSIDSLLSLFREFGLNDPADLVALSGGHTVGKTKICSIVRQNFKATCSRNANRQVLDIITPDVFDNQYYVALTRGQGVFDSDHNLLGHPATQNLVRDFANNKQKFFDQWATSLKKLSGINWLTQASGGQIRLNCSRPNPRRLNDIIEAGEGFAASA